MPLFLVKLLYGRFQERRSIDLENAWFEIYSQFVTPEMSETVAKQMAQKSLDLAKVWIEQRNKKIKPL